MNQVTIYDVAAAYGSDSASGWYTQQTSGIAPEPRVDFCVVLATAPDNSSQNIFLYGGWDPTINQPYDQIWVLSLPSFTWIQIYNGTSPRFGHTCHATGNRQFITVGGLDQSNVTDSCDWEYKSVAVYDMTDEDPGWGSIYFADKPPFQVPSKIYSVVGGNADGKATNLTPSNGWSSAGLAKIMTGTTNQTAPATIPSPATSPSPSPSSGSEHHSSSHLSGGAIAGFVIGSVAGAIIIAALLCFLRPRGRKPPEDHQPFWKKRKHEMNATDNEINEMPSPLPPSELHAIPVVELPVHEPYEMRKPVELHSPSAQEYFEQPNFNPHGGGFVR